MSFPVMNSVSSEKSVEDGEKMTEGDQGNKASDEVEDLFWIGQNSSILEFIVSGSSHDVS